MNKQEAFDKAAIHLLRQKITSVNRNNQFECAYRGKNGRKCAIGALIPDNEYSSNMEGKPIIEIQMSIPSLNGIDSKFLMDLQKVHDRCYDFNFKARLYRFAKTYDLNTLVFDRHGL